LKLSIVIPSYNGVDKLPQLIGKIHKSLSANMDYKDFEIIIADDGSLIKPTEIINSFRIFGMIVEGVFLKKNYGQQFATFAGLRVSKGEYVLTVDDDLSHKPEDFKKLLHIIEKDNFDVVFGVPLYSNYGILRQIGSGFRDLIFNIFFKLPRDLNVSSFRILNRSLVDKIISDIAEYRYLSVEILKHTSAIGNIDVEYNRGSETNSRYNLFKLVFLVFSLIRCSRIFPERIRKSGIASNMEWDLI